VLAEKAQRGGVAEPLKVGWHKTAARRGDVHSQNVEIVSATSLSSPTAPTSTRWCPPDISWFISTMIHLP
jgi:hypothetical protein